MRRSTVSGRGLRIGGAVIVVLAAAWYLVGRGGSPTLTGSVATDPATVTVDTSPDEGARALENAPVETFEVFVPKDPFKQLVKRSAGASKAGAGAGVSVRLVDAFKAGGRNHAQVDVDDRLFTIEEGARFAKHFELVSVEGRCASMLFGDDQFTLCKGDEIVK